MKIKISDKPQKTFYIYCRVSTTGQDKDGYSLDVQEGRGIKLSKQLNLKPIVIQEQGSGMKPYLDVRPLFSELMDGVNDGYVKNVWIDDDTRLTRNDVDQQMIHVTMKKYGVNLYVGSSHTPKKWDWITDLVDTIITKVNKNQIETQVRKSRRSVRKKYKEGCWMKGKPPFGYDLVEKRLVINKEESEILKKVFDWYDTGKSVYRIEKELFSLGIDMSKRMIRKWLTKEVYIGIDTFGDLVGKSPKIIDETTFRSVGKKIESQSTRTRFPKTEFLLRDIIKCPDGCNMSTLGKKKSRKNPLYVCRHRVRKYDGRKTDECVITKSIRQELMDDYVWNSLIDVLKQSHTIKEKTKKELLGKTSGYTKRSINRKIKNVQKEIYELEKNQMVLDKKYYTNQMEEKKYDILVKTIEGRGKELMGNLTSLQMKLDVFSENKMWIDWLSVHFSRMEEIRNTENFKNRREILLHYIHEIIVLNYDEDTKQHTISIKFRFPLFNDKHDWVSNKDGSYRLDSLGRRKYDVTDGEKQMNTFLTPHVEHYSHIIR